jgi:hypothetical protein
MIKYLEGVMAKARHSYDMQASAQGFHQFTSW